MMEMRENGEKENRTVFLISPVRGIEENEVRGIDIYVKRLEAEGWQVYVPLRHTDQDDPIGLRICEDNLAAIRKATEVHIWFNPTSQGSVFDLGMAFALGKKVVLANPEMVQPTEGKSFSNVLLAYTAKS